jgi:spore germination cell wall hydrolase CwlJ-like protein
MLAVVAVTAVVLAIMAAQQGMFPAGNHRSRNSITIDVPPAVKPQRLMAIGPEDARAANVRRPFATDAIIAARPFFFSGSVEARARALDCVAAAEWYEAGDDIAGERAVAQTVLNRVRHPAFPATLCGVVFQGADRATGCQFTFTCDGSLARTPSAAAWARARAIASAALDGQVTASIGYATHYHANWVVPYWAPSLDKIAQIGPHIFYRWSGFWGTPIAFRRGALGKEPIIKALARLSPPHALEGAAPAIEETAAKPEAETLPKQVPVIAKSDLRGSTLRGVDPGSRSFLVELDKAAFPGSYASVALAICRGKSTCQVLGWRDSGQVPSELPLSDTARNSMSFVYSRSSKTGETALWNCSQTPRAEVSQCLPTGNIDIDKILLK